MTGGSDAKGAPPDFTPEGAAGWLSELGEQDRRAALAWAGEHLTELRQSVYGQRILYWTLGISFVLGLAIHVGAYLLKSSVTTEPLGLIADLLYALGFSLWTGGVVVLFLQIVPEAKRRQFKSVLDAYEAARRDEARKGSNQATEGDEAPT